MSSGRRVAVLNVDGKGNYWRETVTANEAVLKLLRFLRKNPQSICTIELRRTDMAQHELSVSGEAPVPHEDTEIAPSVADASAATSAGQTLIGSVAPKAEMPLCAQQNAATG